MPKSYRRKFKKKYRKRGYQRSASRSWLTNPSRLPLFGNSRRVKLVYNQIVNLDAAANPAVAVHVFSANGIFDPDITLTGHQPRGFDEIIALFNHWVVLSSTIKCISPASTSTISWGIALQSISTLQTTLVNYNEGRRQVHTCATDAAGPATRLQMTYSPRGFLSRSNPTADSQLKGSIAANPLEGAFYHVYTGHMNPGSNPGDVAIDVMITYDVLFFEPFTPVIS